MTSFFKPEFFSTSPSLSSSTSNPLPSPSLLFISPQLISLHHSTRLIKWPTNLNDYYGSIVNASKLSYQHSSLSVISFSRTFLLSNYLTYDKFSSSHHAFLAVPTFIPKLRTFLQANKSLQLWYVMKKKIQPLKADHTKAITTLSLGK